jgi:hypothetical protein
MLMVMMWENKCGEEAEEEIIRTEEFICDVA